MLYWFISRRTSGKVEGFILEAPRPARSVGPVFPAAGSADEIDIPITTSNVIVLLDQDNGFVTLNPDKCGRDIISGTETGGPSTKDQIVNSLDMFRLDTATALVTIFVLESVWLARGGCEQEESREHARGKHRSFHLEANNETVFWFSVL
jgi:hypothetical protein